MHRRFSGIDPGGRRVQADQIIRLLRDRPFLPLRVHLTDGAVLEIRAPRQAIVGSTWLDIGIPDPRLPEGIYDHIRTIPLTAVARVEQDTASTASQGS
jgi:hypothetical protein